MHGVQWSMGSGGRCHERKQTFCSPGSQEETGDWCRQKSPEMQGPYGGYGAWHPRWRSASVGVERDEGGRGAPEGEGRVRADRQRQRQRMPSSGVPREARCVDGGRRDASDNSPSTGRSAASA